MRLKVLSDSIIASCSVIIFNVVLLVEVPLFLVEVDQFLVQRLIEQLEILQTSLDIAVFPEPILSSADVTQHTLEFVVVQRLPSV